MSERTVLVTGFGPFPGAPFNPSGPLVRKLARLRRPAFADLQVIPHVFKTSYRSVDRDLPHLLAQYRPDAILMFGLATRSRHVRVETQARNTLSAFPDASGQTATATTIAHGPRSRLPIRAPRMALRQAARRGRLPVRLSQDAGRYLCNYLYWRALDAATKAGRPGIVAFIHIPNTGRRPIRKKRRLRRVTARDLLRTGENLLAAVAAALKRPHCR